MNLRVLIFDFCFLLSAFECAAATWYAAANGTSTNGTSLLPWPVSPAFSNTYGFLQSGDTVIFKSGTYYPTNDVTFVTPLYFTNTIGVRVSGITYKSEVLWGFRLKGGLQFVTTSLVSDTTIHGMVLDLSRGRSYTNASEEIFGVNIYAGNGIRILHCLIENQNGGGLGKWRTASNCVSSGNIVRFNGAADWTERYTAGVFQRGSGVYSENDTGTMVFNGNILYHNHTHGISIKTYLNGFSLTNNAAYGLKNAGIDLENSDLPTAGINIVSNFVWKSPVGLQLGYNYWGSTTHPGSYGNSNMFVLGNTIVGSLKGISLNNQAKQATVQTNRVVFLGTHGDGSSGFATEYNVFSLEPTAPTNSPSYSFSGNEYFSPTATINNLSYLGNPITFANWQTALGDAGSSYSIGVPSSQSVNVFRPTSDTNFVQVVVYNWQTNATASVDLSAYFPSGARLAIYDAQNIPTACSNLTYSGGSIALPLTLTNRAEMYGSFDDTVAWAGFDPRYRAFVIVRELSTSSAASLTANTATIGTFVAQ